MKISVKLLSIPFVVVIIVGGIVMYMRPGWFGFPPKKINSGYPLWVTDLNDKRKLVGISNNVFVGRVISQEGTHKREFAIPETDFKVEVLSNIKGKLPPFITATQLGGLDEQANTIILVENDELIKPGMTYLFVTKTGKDKELHTIVSKLGDLSITDEQGQQKLIQEFEEAYKNEIPYIMKDGTNEGISNIQDVTMQ